MEKEKTIRYCPNCGEIVDNRFCPACGQENREYNHTFSELSREFISHTFNLDSRFVITLRLLLFKPGYLTKEYFKGRRESYISPFRLYLIISMIYFLIFTVQYFYSDIKSCVELVESSIEMEQADSLQAIAMDETLQMYNSNPDEETSVQLFNKDIQLNPDEVKSAFTSNSPRIMFFLLPITAVILKLLYSRRKYLYYQHLIFLVHLHTFFFLMMTINRILPYTPVDFFILSAIVVYSYVAFKKFYQQKALKTIFKLSCFSFFYGLILAFLSMINLLISIFTLI